MPTCHPLTVSHTPELVETSVAAGLYTCASEVVRAGLRLLAEQQGSALLDRTSAGLPLQPVGLRAVRKDAAHG